MLKLSSRRFAALSLLVLLISSAAVATGCGGSDEKSAGATAATQESPKFVKTRIALHLGLAAGAAHRWIYKPYKAGGFKKGADKRKRTIAKGVLAAAFVAYEAKKAKALAKKDPSLAPLADKISGMIAKYGSLGAVLAGTSGSLSEVDGAKSILDEVLGAAKSEGVDAQEQVPSTAQLLQAK